MSSSCAVRSQDGTNIFYEQVGIGPAIILVEPAGHYRDLSAFDGLVPLLAPHFTVYTYDRRGRGLSGDTQPYAPDREVEDLDALIRAAGGRTFLYGYSSGALLALHATVKLASIDGLVLLEPPLQPDDAARPDPLTVELADLVKGDRRDAAVRHFHASIGVPAEMIEIMSDTANWSKMVTIAHTLVYDCRLSDATTSDLCRSIDVPTLVLDSEGSTDNLTGWAAAAARQIPNAHHKSLPGQWHQVAPELLAAELREFFKT